MQFEIRFAITIIIIIALIIIVLRIVFPPKPILVIDGNNTRKDLVENIEVFSQNFTEYLIVKEQLKQLGKQRIALATTWNDIENNTKQTEAIILTRDSLCTKSSEVFKAWSRAEKYLLANIQNEHIWIRFGDYLVGRYNFIIPREYGTMNEPHIKVIKYTDRPPILKDEIAPEWCR